MTGDAVTNRSHTQADVFLQITVKEKAVYTLDYSGGAGVIVDSAGAFSLVGTSVALRQLENALARAARHLEFEAAQGRNGVTHV